tara:strand:+ start:667 stop:2625 length:1959 start_codon:yes stop_codon:yes gene_type:complete
MKVELNSGRLVMRPEKPRDYTIVKDVPGAEYESGIARWVAPHSSASHKVLVKLGLMPNNIAAPTNGEVQIYKLKNTLVLESPIQYAGLAKAFPDRRFWQPSQGKVGAWIFSPTASNIAHAIKAFPDARWDEASTVLRLEVEKQISISRLMAEAKNAAEASSLKSPDYKFNAEFPPFAHQEHVFTLSRDSEEFALFMEMGTGKTRVVIDTATYLFQQGKINGVIVICPNSIKSTWTEEIEKMAPEWSTHDVTMWQSGAGKKVLDKLHGFMMKESGTSLKWFVTNVEGYSTGKLFEKAADFAALHKCMIVIDESSRVKTPSAKRTKNITKLGRKAKYKRIMSGTPVTQGPLDLYGQFRFLDPHILGYGSYYAFRNRYAIMGGFQQKAVVGYSYVEELVGLVDPYTYRVLRADCIDLPEKVYQKLTIQLGPEQRRAYDQMKNDMLTDLGEHKVSVTIVITQLLRLQQIVGGFLPVTTHNDLTMLSETHTEKIEGKNAKMDTLTEFLQEGDQSAKAIVWARFRAEIDMIADTLREKFGVESVVEFHGGTSADARTKARLDFQDPTSPVRFFIGQTETGGLGITLTAASLVVYFSNSFSLESRLQSEDRAHRIGQTKTVTYIDLVAEKTLDAKLLKALRAKKNLADLVTGDNVSEWV